MTLVFASFLYAKATNFNRKTRANIINAILITVIIQKYFSVHLYLALFVVVVDNPSYFISIQEASSEMQQPVQQFSQQTKQIPVAHSLFTRRANSY